MIEIIKMPEDETLSRQDCTCFFCGGKLAWMSDFTYAEVFNEGEGIVSYLKCLSCGCTAEFSRRDDTPEDTDNTMKSNMEGASHDE